MRMILWGGFQLAVIGFWLWIAYERQQAGEDPQVGMAIFMGVSSAFILTAFPYVLKDVIIGQWRYWRGDFSKPRGVDPGLAQPANDRLAGSAPGDRVARLVKRG